MLISRGPQRTRVLNRRRLRPGRRRVSDPHGLSHDSGHQPLPANEKQPATTTLRGAIAVSSRDDCRIFEPYAGLVETYTEVFSSRLVAASVQQVSRLIYDDSEKSFFESFPWTRLREMLAYKLDDRGITLTTIASRKNGPDRAQETR